MDDEAAYLGMDKEDPFEGVIAAGLIYSYSDTKSVLLCYP